MDLKISYLFILFVYKKTPHGRFNPQHESLQFFLTPSTIGTETHSSNKTNSTRTDGPHVHTRKNNPITVLLPLSTKQLRFPVIYIWINKV